MERTMTLLILFVVVMTALAALGAVPGWTAPPLQSVGAGAVAIVLLLLGNALARTVTATLANRLDAIGFERLMELHYAAVTNDLIDTLHEVLVQHEDDLENIDWDKVLLDVRSVIEMARRKLAPFAGPGIADVPAYLDRHLDAEQLRGYIEQARELVNRADTTAAREQAVYRLVRRIQGDFLSTLHADAMLPDRRGH